MESDPASLDSSVAWLGIVAYALHIYYDFSGYSDMAIGLGRMFGFRIFENFNHPYISLSIKEFWRRWHISLSIWFRDYVYIPLGGSRRGSFRTYYNLFIVFLLTGFWHGATWSFVFWGLFHGLFVILERVGLDKLLAKVPVLVRWSYTILVVLIGWVFFKIESFENAIDYLGRMFVSNSVSSGDVYSYLDIEKLIILSGAVFFCYPWFKTLFKSERMVAFVSFPAVQLVVNSTIILLFVLSVLYINSGSYNPFIYLRF
jgi:alginate O-acetyltransferase complex protein AlgI